MNSYAIDLERLRMIKPYNPVLLHYKDPGKYGDTVAVESPAGKVVPNQKLASVD